VYVSVLHRDLVVPLPLVQLAEDAAAMQSWMLGCG